MTVQNRPVSEFMTKSPHSVGLEQTVQFAKERMQSLGIRHLPVLHGGELLGVLSDRDVSRIETLRGIEPQAVTIEDAMTPEPYVTTPDTSLQEVVRTMAEHKYGCAVVMEGSKIAGLLTTTDAMRILAEALEA